MRLVLIFISGCSLAKESNTLSGYWETELISNVEVVEMPAIRRYLENDSRILTIRNERIFAHEISSIEHPEWLNIEAEFPLVLASGEDVDFVITWDSTYIAGIHMDRIRLKDGENSLFELDIQGEIEPYVQVKRQELSEIRSQIEEEVEDQNLIGAAVAIVEGQDIVFLEGFGYADRENEILVDPSVHRFRWASVAKNITAVLAVQQQEEGLLSLDDSIEHLYGEYQMPSLYLPDDWVDIDSAEVIPADTGELTLRMLLSHTGCVQHYSNGLVDPEPATTDRNDPAINTGMEWALEYWQDAPLICLPGTTFSYSTFGYNLAGVALESATGSSLEMLVTDRISSVVGSMTLFPDRHWEPAPDRVVGYNRSEGVISAGGNSDVSWKLAGGGFISTPEDLARYCAGLLGEVLVGSTVRDEELWTIQPATADYGLGFYVSGEYISHSGSQQSARTGLFIDRQQNRCIIAMSNSTWADPFELIWAALSQ